MVEDMVSVMVIWKQGDLILVPVFVVMHYSHPCFALTVLVDYEFHQVMPSKDLYPICHSLVFHCILKNRVLKIYLSRSMTIWLATHQKLLKGQYNQITTWRVFSLYQIRKLLCGTPPPPHPPPPPTPITSNKLYDPESGLLHQV